MSGTLRFCVASLLLAAPATAQGPDATVDAGSGAPGLFRKGSMHVAFLAGYGVGFRAGSKADRQKSKELGHVRIVNVIPRLGIGMTDPLGGDAFYRGNFETLFEGALLLNTQSHFGVGGGVGTTLRYNFLFDEGVFVPYLDLNFGVVAIDFDRKRQSDGFNFNVGTGAGAHWFVGDRTAIDTEVRWQHISNAGTRHPNDGINDALFLVGVSYFFR